MYQSIIAYTGTCYHCFDERTPRESKLTRLLQESLGGRTKTSIVATLLNNFFSLVMVLESVFSFLWMFNSQAVSSCNLRMSRCLLEVLQTLLEEDCQHCHDLCKWF